MNEDLVKRINDALNDMEEVVDFRVEDVDSDAELIEVIIRGRLKEGLSRPKEDPASDYDRAMKGLPCIQSQYTKSNN